MKKSKTEKGIIVITVIVSITFVLLMTYQVKENAKLYSYSEAIEESNDTLYDGLKQPMMGKMKNMNITEILLQHGIEFSLRSAQICLVLALILFIIWFMVCGIRKEIKLKQGITVIGVIFALLILVSYILFIADFGVEG